MNIVEADHKQIVNDALRIHDELRDWCYATFGLETENLPVVTVSGYYVSLGIGEIHIWDTESGYSDENGGDELWLDRCIECFHTNLKRMLLIPS